MPFRHVAMYRWADHVDAAHVDRVRDALDELASITTGVQQHVHGRDVGVSADSFDYHVVADFDTIADWRAYRDHPAHVLLEAELIDGHALDRATGQFQTADIRSAHEVSAMRMETFLAEPDDDTGPAGESDDELIARARRAATADLQAFLAEPDDGP
ncbi:MAG: Dabb family protein [Acidimicrobiia bacterium]